MIIKDYVAFNAESPDKFNYILVRQEETQHWYLYKMPKAVELPLDKNRSVKNLNSK